MTHYETLGVSEDATPEEIKAAYRILVRKNHPDLIGDEGVEKTALINAAYTVIGDPDSRTLYNADLRSERGRTARPDTDYVPPRDDWSGWNTDVHSEPFFDDRQYGYEHPVEPEPELANEPLRFVDFWDHPLTRRKLIVGMVGVATLIAAAITVILMPVAAKQVAVFGLILAPITAVVWRPPAFLRIITVLSFFAPLVSLDDLTIKIVYVSLMIATLPALRYGALAFRSVLSQISDDRNERARIRRARAADERAQKAAEKKAEREAQYQRAAAERRAARQAKKSR
jgi:hypothetical protein